MICSIIIHDFSYKSFLNREKFVCILIHIAANVTHGVRDSCVIFVSLAHRPASLQRCGLRWPKWEKTVAVRARGVTMVLGYECPNLFRRTCLPLKWTQLKLTTAIFTEEFWTLLAEIFKLYWYVIRVLKVNIFREKNSDIKIMHKKSILQG